MLFSIITICKNTLEDLQVTHSSLAAQKHSDYEWIVIDGDSTDGTKFWLKNNPTVTRWVSEPDKGIYDAMNKGISMSTGDYLNFMNSGDEFENSHILSKINDILDRSDEKPALIYGDSIDVDENENQFYRRSKKASFIKYGMITQHQAMFFNRLSLPGFYDAHAFRLSADYALIASVIKDNNPERIRQVNFPVCKFKMGGLNESRRYKAIKEDFVIRRRVLKLSMLESLVLYALHFSHATVKHSFKKSRFFRHKKVNGGAHQ